MKVGCAGFQQPEHQGGFLPFESLPRGETFTVKVQAVPKLLRQCGTGRTGVLSPARMVAGNHNCKDKPVRQMDAEMLFSARLAVPHWEQDRETPPLQEQHSAA